MEDYLAYAGVAGFFLLFLVSVLFSSRRLTRLESERAALQKRLSEAEAGFHSASRPASEVHAVSEASEAMQRELLRYKQKMEEYYHRSMLLELLIRRYGKQIGETETKTAQDLKAAIQPADKTIMGLADRIRKESGARDAIRLCSAAYDYVVDEIHSVPSIGVMFWMTFKEMLDNKVADYEDKAILLCSLFRALGAEASVAIAEFSNGSNRPLIFVGRGESVVLCDPNEKHGFMDFVGRRESVLKRYRVGGESVKRLVYEFSDTEYTDHSRET